MKVELYLLDLCEILGGMYNAVEFLIEKIKKYKNCKYSYNYHNYDVFQFKHYLSKFKSEYFEKKGDNIGIEMRIRDWAINNSSTFTYGYIRTLPKYKFTIKFFDIDENFYDGIEEIRNRESERIKKEKEIKLKMKDIDPFGEEKWLDESHIKKYENFLNETINNPIQDDVPFVYNNWYSLNHDGFKNDIINDLREKLIGKTIYIDGTRDYNWKEEIEPIDKLVVNGKKIKPLYKITVKDFLYSGEERRDVYYVNVIDTEDKVYKFRKLIDKKVYDRWAKKVEVELEKIEEEKRRKERLKIKHLYHDPYGEEKWEEDD